MDFGPMSPPPRSTLKRTSPELAPEMDPSLATLNARPQTAGKAPTPAREESAAKEIVCPVCCVTMGDTGCLW